MTICAECLSLSVFLFCLLFGVVYCLLLLDDDGDVQPDPTHYSGAGRTTMVVVQDDVASLDCRTRKVETGTVVMASWPSDLWDDAPLGLGDDDPEYLDIPGGNYFA